MREGRAKRARDAKVSQAVNPALTKALLQAQRESSPWYRCQSLAAVARIALEGEVARIARQALSAAQDGKDAYQRVAVSAWPVQALAERGKVQQAQNALTALLAEAEQIEHPVSRIGALALLWKAAWPLPTAIRQPALDALLSACRKADSWRAGRIMRDVALVVAAEDRDMAARIASVMRESVYKRQAQKRLEAGQSIALSSFFPEAAQAVLNKPADL